MLQKEELIEKWEPVLNGNATEPANIIESMPLPKKRKLASIQKIHSLTPIEGADAIETAGVLGWQVVVKKGEFKVGDLCVYCEIDSILPELPAFEFLRPRNFRIKTVKLKKQISQGICFPLDMLDGYAATIKSNLLYDKYWDMMETYQVFPVEGHDCTDFMHVVKYEPAIHSSLSGEARGNFPSFIPKTDEERIQSSPWLLEKFPDLEMVACEKLDGSSATFYIKDGEFGVCSRNLDLKPGESKFWQAAEKYKIEEKLRAAGKNIAIQGELIGPNIQQNKYKLTETELYFFNVFLIDEHRYLPYEEAEFFIECMSLKFVPVILQGEIGTQTVQDLIKLSQFKSKLNQDTWAEGLVFRPLNKEVEVDRFGRFSFKVINPEFLLKNGE